MKHSILLFSINHWLLVILLILVSCTNDQVDRKPNFVFLFADDLSYNALGYLGNSVVQTPNIDRIAQTGISFTNTYNMGGWNAAICVASRSMIISGLSIWDAHKATKNWSDNDSVVVNQTWPKLLEQNGYQTFMTGKWHVELPVESVFQRVGTERPGMPGDRRMETPFQEIEEAYRLGEDTNYLFPIGYARPVDENDLSWSPTDSIHGGFWEGGKHWSEVVRDEAFAFLEEAQENANPFFMYLSFNAPHDPRQAPQEYVDLYPLEDIDLPTSFLEEYPHKDDIGNDLLLRDESLAPFPRTPHAIKTHIQEYYAIISHLDTQVGLILDQLEQSGSLDNTYIFFAADHGLSVGSHGLLGKQSMYDHSVRVPFIMAGPGIQGGQIATQAIYLQDVMPTTLELANIAIPNRVFFHSVMDIANQQNTTGHYEDGIYGAYRHLQRMIQKDHYKLIVYPAIQKILLFDLNNDPHEMTDLSSLEEYQPKVESLMNDLKSLQIQLNDTVNLRIDP
ncbi:MAG: sulfatase-like hydrolase/transferase [Flavobacteriaceae bacterium]|nr:sulfatase-like hydrolase/transferase [Flavobacteriaceae bacterium]